MGGRSSTESKQKSYDNNKYTPSKRTKIVNGTNNNYLSDRYLPTQLAQYWLTNSVLREEMTVVTLENVLENDGPAISPIQLDVMFHSESLLHFKFHDPNTRRFEVCYADMHNEFPQFYKRVQQTMYDIQYEEKPFGMTVTRRSNGHILFNTNKGKLHFEDRKLKISTEVNSRYVYGLGEHRKNFLIDTTNAHNFVFWARDQPPQENRNLYGVHPFFMALEDDGNAYGVFLHSSSAMEIDIIPGNPAIFSYTTNGGILDFYIFMGPTPIEVIQQYQAVIGRPLLPPYWALGHHLCRWGYETTDQLRKVIKRTRDSQIPYESQWTDIDMMQNKQVWTYKQPDLANVVQDLHRQGQRYIMIVDPGVGIENKTQLAYIDGLDKHIFIQHYDGSRPLVGRVWPGETVFPDFSHPQIYEYWFKQAQRLYNSIPFDGMWLDMNEPANFASGCVEGCDLTDTHPLDRGSFAPNIWKGKGLYDKTICPSARQHKGQHYDLHNLYGHMQMKVSQEVCHNLIGRRSLIISRSTFAGSGKYGGHWTGDNHSTFQDLRYSISAMLDFNMFGIPLVGADIGGFWGTCSEELMIRWMQVGAFYPFMRNHNAHSGYGSAAEETADQDPAVYSQEAQKIMVDITNLRYSLLPYLYTLMFDNHTQGLPVVRSLFMLFPRDKHTYDIDEQFMWGKALLFSPCLRQGQKKVDAYFPYDIWYDFYDGTRLNEVGAWLELPTPLHHSNIHIRGGSLLVTQSPARNTTYSRKNPFGILVALSSKHTASGKLYWDDGESLDPVTNETFNLINFSVSQSCLTSQVERKGLDCVMKLKLVQVFGLYVQPDHVLVNGKGVKFCYDDSASVLQIDKLDVSLLQPLKIEW